MNHSDLLSLVLDLLLHNSDAAVKLGEPIELDSQFTVLRVPVIESNHLPESVVIKQIPEDARFGADARFRSEWAGLEFANQLTTDTRFAPQIIAANIEERIIILEDLGDVHNLNTQLHDHTIDGRAILTQYGTFLGTMHAASIGRQKEFEAIQKRLNADVPPNDSSRDLRDMLDKVHEAFDPNPHMNKTFIEEIVQASAIVHDESAYFAFNHHDAGPHNILVTADGLRFVDFEFSTYSHAFMDMTAVHLAFPPFSMGHPIPKTAIKAYETAYRDALTETAATISDDDFELMVEQCCAKWIVTKFLGLGSELYPIFVNNELEQLSNPAIAEQVPMIRKRSMTWLSCYLDYFSDKPKLTAIYKVLQSLYDKTLQCNDDIEFIAAYEAF